MMFALCAHASFCTLIHAGNENAFSKRVFFTTFPAGNGKDYLHSFAKFYISLEEVPVWVPIAEPMREAGESRVSFLKLGIAKAETRLRNEKMKREYSIKI